MDEKKERKSAPFARVNETRIEFHLTKNAIVSVR